MRWSGWLLLLGGCGGKIAGGGGEAALDEAVAPAAYDKDEAERRCNSVEATSVPQDPGELEAVCTVECRSRVRCSGAHIGVCMKTCVEESQLGKCVACTQAFWRCQSRNKRVTDDTCGTLDAVVEPECDRAYRAMVACRP